MYHEATIILGLIIIFMIGLFYVSQLSEVAYVKSSIDGQTYLVRNLADKANATDLLANLKQRLNQIVSLLNKDDARVMLLKSRFKNTIFAERSRDHIYTSYTVNKGYKIVFCLRQENGHFVDENTLLFVALHELAHVMTKDSDHSTGGHSPEFWQNFEMLLKVAHRAQIYQYIDYQQHPVEYCGRLIKNNPLSKTL